MGLDTRLDTRLDMRLDLARIAAILFVSGFCSLVYQVMWLRSLRLVFGSSTPATAVVLAIFMAGLGLGGWIFGRRVERSPHPLAFYARLELGISLSAAASLVLLPLVRELYLGLGGSSVLGTTGATVLRLVFAALILGVPTTLMGGTLPAVAQAVERGADLGRRRVATLYGVNTLGAVVGAFCSTFFFLELLGVSRTFLFAVMINLLLALVLRSWAREMEEGATETSKDEAKEGAPEPEDRIAAANAEALVEAGEEGSGPPLVAAPLLFAVAGLVGFLFFLMEIVWYRMLAPLLGGSAYTFGLILTLALAGIGLGAWLYSRGSESRRPTVEALAASLALEAFFLAVPLGLGDRLAFLAGVLRDLQAGGFWGLLLSWTFLAGLVVFPAALVAGYQFPLLVGLLGSGREHVGSEVGRAYAWNTWGSVLGSLLGGLALLPLLGAVTLWRASALALLAASVAVFILARLARFRARGDDGRSRSLAFVTWGLVVLTVPLGLAQGPTSFWRHQPWGAGRVMLDAGDPNDLRRDILLARRLLVAESEGVESSVALVGGSDLSLRVNGKSDGSSHGDAPTQVMGGLVGAAIHPAPKQALVVGLGTGMTAGWLARVPQVEHLDVVELEPSVVEFSHHFRAAHHDVLQSPKVDLHIGDGREWIRTTDRSYDLIFSEPSNPYRAGVADLFSRDFYEAVSRRLEPDGIFIHWTQAYEVDADALRIIYSTLREVFPSVETWQPHSQDLLLLASNEERPLDFDAIRERVEAEPYRSAMRAVWQVEGEAAFYSAFLGGNALAEHMRFDHVSTDDRPVLEFAFARSLGRTGLLQMADLRGLALRVGAHRPAGTGTPPSWDDVDELSGVRSAAGTLSLAGDGQGRPGYEARQDARLAFTNSRWDLVLPAWGRQDEAPRALRDRLMIAAAAAAANHHEAAEILQGLLPERPAERAILRSRLHVERGEVDAAAEALVRGLEEARSATWIERLILSHAVELATRLGGEDPRWIAPLFDALDVDLYGLILAEQRRWARLFLAELSEDPGLCVEALETFEPNVPWRSPFLERRLRCYAAAGHPAEARARRDLERFLADAPSELVEVVAGDS